MTDRKRSMRLEISVPQEWVPVLEQAIGDESWSRFILLAVRKAVRPELRREMRLEDLRRQGRPPKKKAVGTKKKSGRRRVS